MRSPSAALVRAIRRALSSPAAGKRQMAPRGPIEPNVVLVDFVADRIETWNTPGQIVPDPTKGLWAAVLTRDANG
jgi:hypothetical protein